MANIPAPQLVRISTIVAAYSSVFTAEDAFGLPEELPPVRKIGLGRRSLTGFLGSAKKAEGLPAFESALERDFYALLEFDSSVVAWHPQPVKVKVPGRRAPYRPDVAVEYRSGQGDQPSTEHIELCEIKYREELKRDWSKLKPAFKAGIRFARSQGWRFSIYTEVEIRTQRLKNAKFFLTYADRGTDAEDIHRLAVELLNGNSTPHALMSRLDPIERPRMLGVLWHMVAKNLIDLDMSSEVTMQTPIKLNEQTF